MQNTSCQIFYCNKISIFSFQRTGYSFKKDEIEHSILHRVHSLFNRATGKWKVSGFVLRFGILFFLHARSLYPGCVACLSVYKRFYTLWGWFSSFDFQQDDVQLWLSHVAFCKQWVSFQILILPRLRLVLIHASETWFKDKVTYFTATCCKTEKKIDSIVGAAWDFHWCM